MNYLKQEATLLFSVCLKIVLIGMTFLFLMAVAHAASPCLIYLNALKGRGYELQSKLEEVANAACTVIREQHPYDAHKGQSAVDKFKTMLPLKLP